jgi:hypothetical protein
MISSRIGTAARLIVPVVGALIATNGTAQVIVHYTADDLARAPQWALAEPDLALGVVDGDQSFVFSGLGRIQVIGDGSIAVTNWAPPEIRVFDGNGRHLHSTGSEGSGPGEFVQPTQLFRLGSDSLVTWDIAQARGPVYSTRGEYGRQVRLPDRPRASVAGAFEDGTLLVLSMTYGPTADGGSRRVSYNGVLHADTDGAIVDSLGWIPGVQLVRIPEVGYWTNPTFSPQGFAVAGPRTVWLADGSSPRLRELDRSGRLVSEVTWDPGDRRVTDEEVELFWQAYEARGEDFAESARSRRHLPTAPEFPATGRLMIDADELIWVQVNTRPSQPDQRWLIFDSERTLIARLQAPEGFSVRDASAGQVYGVAKDVWDVERVERRAIRR